MKIVTLKPRVKPLSTRRLPSAVASVRMRGRGRQERNERLFMRNPCCVRCEAKGLTTVVTQWDHIVPLFAGGPDTQDNLQGLCDACHVDKSNEDRVRYGNAPIR